jgi:hypothetical protein
MEVSPATPVHTLASMGAELEVLAVDGAVCANAGSEKPTPSNKARILLFITTPPGWDLLK